MHGASLKGLNAFLKEVTPVGGGGLLELQLTSLEGCKVTNSCMVNWATLGVHYLTIEAAEKLSKRAVRAAIGLRELRVKGCGGDLQPGSDGRSSLPAASCDAASASPRDGTSS